MKKLMALGMALGEALVGATAARMGRDGKNRMERLEKLRGESAEPEHQAVAGTRIHRNEGI